MAFLLSLKFQGRVSVKAQTLLVIFQGLFVNCWHTLKYYFIFLMANFSQSCDILSVHVMNIIYVVYQEKYFFIFVNE